MSCISALVLAAPAWQSGVWREASVPADVFAFTLDKSRGGFSPTTRYRDAALSPELIHWESQTATSVASDTGQRYLYHDEIGSHILLFAQSHTYDDQSEGFGTSRALQSACCG